MAESILNNRSRTDSTIFLSATELSALSVSDRTALYQGGGRQLIVENGDTITNHVLKEDGGTVWLGSNKPVVNLLDNSDFTNTVNQKGNLNYVGNWIHGPDRWFVVTSNTQSPADQSIWIDPLWVNMNYYHELIQRIEWKKVAGKTLTIAVENSQGIRQSVGGIKVPETKDMTQSLVYGSVWGDNYILEGISFTNNSCFDIRIRSAYNGWQGIRWAALYEGTYNDETVPPYKPKGYTAELTECRRHYRPNEVFKCVKTSGNYFSVSGIVDMNAPPYVEFVSFAPYGSANITDFSNCSMSFAQNTPGIQRVHYAELPTCSAHNAGGLTVNLYSYLT